MSGGRPASHALAPPNFELPPLMDEDGGYYQVFGWLFNDEDMEEWGQESEVVKGCAALDTTTLKDLGNFVLSLQLTKRSRTEQGP
ncbi:hypothetical protein C0995_012419 [Termitomyces sp. Mi166|nr:hypothetical protein C0995_012419 [Termitomyces sp. Mi166\